MLKKRQLEEKGREKKKTHGCISTLHETFGFADVAVRQKEEEAGFA